MALEFICSAIIMQGKRIKIPRRADCYRCKSGKINFFSLDSVSGENMIPEKARYVSFEIERNKFNIEYGDPDFYDGQGNDLKIHNC